RARLRGLHGPCSSRLEDGLITLCHLAIQLSVQLRLPSSTHNATFNQLTSTLDLRQLSKNIHTRLQKKGVQNGRPHNTTFHAKRQILGAFNTAANSSIALTASRVTSGGLETSPSLTASSRLPPSCK